MGLRDRYSPDEFSGLEYAQVIDWVTNGIDHDTLNNLSFAASGHTGFQPLDADLSAIAALGFTSAAFLKKTAADTWGLDTSVYLTAEADTLASVMARGATTALQLTSTLAIGTSPFAITSTTLNTNLNADLLDGQHGSYYATASAYVPYTGASAHVDLGAYNLTATGLALTGYLGSSLIPSLAADNLFDLGASDKRWKSIYAGTSLIINTLTLSSGSITSSTGAISFDNENLLTTGTLGAGAITGTSFITSGNIGVAADLDLLSLAFGALTLNGNLGIGTAPSYGLHLSKGNTSDLYGAYILYSYNGTGNGIGTYCSMTALGSGTASQTFQGGKFLSSLWKIGNAAGAVQINIGGRFSATDFANRTYSATGTYNFYGGWFSVEHSATPGIWTNNPVINTYDAFFGLAAGTAPTFGTGHTYWSIYAPVTNANNAIAGSLSIGSTAIPAEKLDVTGNGLISGTLGVTGLITATSGLLVSATNIATDTTTGMKIGTLGGASGQKLGFWNTAPIVQPVLATGAGKVVDDVITVLQNLGLVRQT